MSFRPKTIRNSRAFYILLALLLAIPTALYFSMGRASNYGENIGSVDWLPDGTSNVSYYKSKQIEVYEFETTFEQFCTWAHSRGLVVEPIVEPISLKRYSAYMPQADGDRMSNNSDKIATQNSHNWQETLSIQLSSGFVIKAPNEATSIFDPATNKAYHEYQVQP